MEGLEGIDGLQVEISEIGLYWLGELIHFFLSIQLSAKNLFDLIL